MYNKMILIIHTNVFENEIIVRTLCSLSTCVYSLARLVYLGRHISYVPIKQTVNL